MPSLPSPSRKKLRQCAFGSKSCLNLTWRDSQRSPLARNGPYLLWNSHYFLPDRSLYSLTACIQISVLKKVLRRVLKITVWTKHIKRLWPTIWITVWEEKWKKGIWKARPKKTCENDKSLVWEMLRNDFMLSSAGVCGRKPPFGWDLIQGGEDWV